MQRITHVGVLVNSIDEALPKWVDQYGFKLIKRIEVLQEDLYSAFLSLDGTSTEFMVELVEPKHPDDMNNMVAKRLRDKGEGMLHLAMITDDINSAHERLRNGRAAYADREAVTDGCEPRVIVSPKANNGTMIEILSEADWNGVWANS